MKNTSIKEEKNRYPMYSGSCMAIKLLEQVIKIEVIKNTSIKEEKNIYPMYSGSCMTIKLLEQVIKIEV